MGRLSVNAAAVTHVHSHCQRSIYYSDNEWSDYKNADNVFTTSFSTIVSVKTDNEMRAVILRKAT